MTKTMVMAMIVLGAAWWVLAASASEPATQASSATQPGFAPTQPSAEQLEQARLVFHQLMGVTLTDTDKARIEGLIAHLGSDKWTEREEAQKALKSESIAALPLVRKALDSNDVEVAARARDVVKFLQNSSANSPAKLRGAIATRQSARDTAMVGDMIALLSTDDPAVRRTAQWVLRSLTGQDLGFVAGDEADKRQQAARKAQQWWDKNKANFHFGQDLLAALDLGGGVKLELALIPAGKFMMGSPAGETGRFDKEGPQREVTISKPFYMGIYEVTQEQYEQVMGKNPMTFKGAQNPVGQVSWEDAVAFCQAVSRKTGRTVRLPTEAQWEYACRAGAKTRFCFGDDEKQLGEYARYGQTGAGAVPVGRYKPNAWGLYDMHGNVWEWCSDWYADSYANAKNVDPVGQASGSRRVLRGSNWASPPGVCRSARRSSGHPDGRGSYIGFRVAMASPGVD